MEGRDDRDGFPAPSGKDPPTNKSRNTRNRYGSHRFSRVEGGGSRREGRLDTGVTTSTPHLVQPRCATAGRLRLMVKTSLQNPHAKRGCENEEGQLCLVITMRCVRPPGQLSQIGVCRLRRVSRAHRKLRLYDGEKFHSLNQYVIVK